MKLNLKEGDVIFFLDTGTNLYAKLVSLFTTSSYAHVGLITNVTENEVTVVESLGQGVVEITRPMSDLIGMYKEKMIDFLRPKFKVHDIQQIAESYLDIKYGWLDIVNIVIYKIFKKIPFKTEKASIICSELVARILYESSKGKLNFESEYNKDLDLITPDDLWQSKYLQRFDAYTA